MPWIAPQCCNHLRPQQEDGCFCTSLDPHLAMPIDWKLDGLQCTRCVAPLAMSHGPCVVQQPFVPSMGDVARSFWDMMSLLLHHSQAARPAEHWTALSFAGASACKALSPFHRAAPLICTFWCNTRQRTRACTACMISQISKGFVRYFEPACHLVADLRVTR